MVTSRKSVLDCRRTLVQFSDPVDIRHNYQRSDKVHARRSTFARTTCRLVTGMRSHPYLKVYSAIQADSGNQALCHAVHLAVPLDDYGICLALLHRWPYCRSLFSFHTESGVGQQTQGELCHVRTCTSVDHNTRSRSHTSRLLSSASSLTFLRLYSSMLERKISSVR